ncbi:hypothetical protein KCP69_16595 [Salmonella enterica subsp. enterica]|nr:hypothetical protein KCP69_16595 [Salmonella enterica subsp. enterica]
MGSRARYFSFRCVAEEVEKHCCWAVMKTPSGIELRGICDNNDRAKQRVALNLAKMAAIKRQVKLMAAERRASAVLPRSTTSPDASH